MIVIRLNKPLMLYYRVISLLDFQWKIKVLKALFIHKAKTCLPTYRDV